MNGRNDLGPDGTMSFWKSESLRGGSGQYIFGDTTKSRGCAMVTKPSGTDYGDMKIRRLHHQRASGAAARVARREVKTLDSAMSSSTITVLKTLAKHVAAHLRERAFCVVFEDDLERCWPSERLKRTEREKEIQSFARSQGWAAAILTVDPGIRAIFRKPELSFADYEGSSVVPI
jgi:hypothetical protein